MSQTSITRGAVWALVVIWLWSAAASLSPHGMAMGLHWLSELSLSPAWANRIVWMGAAVDALTGLWLASGYRRLRCHQWQFALVSLYTVLTFAWPALWWDPLGPALKNLAVLALLAMLMGDASQVPGSSHARH